MKSTTLVFLGLSVAVHGALFSLHSAPTGMAAKGQQLQVSLLSGERQVTTTASRSGFHGGVKSHASSRNVSTTTTSNNDIKSKNIQDRHKGKDTGNGAIARQATTPLSGDKISHEIHRLLSAKFSYPPLALRQGFQGKVLVTVLIRANGDITDVTLAHSSGYRILDLAAIKSVLAIHRAPQLKQWLRGQTISINVPVIYRLVEA